METKINGYVTRIYWSDDDNAYVAEAPALPGCVGVGSNPQSAAKELGTAMQLWLESAHRHGDPIPEPDLSEGGKML